MFKILAIGNSFSEDATEYVSQIAQAADINILVGNLNIGGCSLEMHAANASANVANYVYSKTNTESRFSSIREALEEENWDFVVMQQASHFSGMYETYQPYLSFLSEYVKKYAPQAEQLIHETWAYELDSLHEGFAHYERSQQQMYLRLKNAYEWASFSIGVARLIPSGDAMQLARSHPIFNYAAGGKSLNRDGFHASLTHGRYLLGLVWVETLTGADLSNNSFIPLREGFPGETPTTDELLVLKNAAHTAVSARSVLRI